MRSLSLLRSTWQAPRSFETEIDLSLKLVYLEMVACCERQPGRCSSSLGQLEELAAVVLSGEPPLSR
jgi:hypothetical protein